MNNLFQAIRINDVALYDNLIQKVNINSIDDNGKNFLHEAIAYKRNNISRDLIQRGINVNHKDEMGQTPLHFCTAHSNEEIAIEILKKGGDPNIVDVHGNNSLWVAVFNARGTYDLVKLILKSGGDPNSINNYGRTPLSFARQINDMILIEILLQGQA
jgi:ankyrin repeat protein